VVEFGLQWKRWAKHRSDAELEEVAQRLTSLLEAFGKPHQHAGLGVRRLEDNAFEFRISRGVRVIFLHQKPNVLNLMMIGNHDDVRAWLKENL
jgi:hypothetical protein